MCQRIAGPPAWEQNNKEEGLVWPWSVLDGLDKAGKGHWRESPRALPLPLVSTFSSESPNNTTEMNGEPLRITSFKNVNKLLFFSLLIIALLNHNLPTRNCTSLK